MNNTEKAKQTLDEAIILSGEPIEQFLKGQNYETPEPIKHLAEALNAI